MNDLQYKYICGLPKAINYVFVNWESFDVDLQQHYFDEIFWDSCWVRRFINDPEIQQDLRNKAIEIADEINSIAGFIEWFGEKFAEDFSE